MSFRTPADNIEFSRASGRSVWGIEHADILSLIEDHVFAGNWLNAAAGDGRYNSRLLAKCNSLVAMDFDESALRKLLDDVCEADQSRVSIQIADITEQLPFGNESFDGIFCTGTLHLFYPLDLQKIFSEMRRVLREPNNVIFDFATDVRRVLPSGDLHEIENTPSYTVDKARSLLDEIFSDGQLSLHEGVVDPIRVHLGRLGYTFSCTVLSGYGTLD